jgi:ribonuclease BN (tRNA processing enzyme)
MKIKFIGVNNAFCTGKNYHSNILIEDNKKLLLYDAGTTIGNALLDNKLTPKDIDSIFISHLHSDHAGGIEYIAFKTYFETVHYGLKTGTMKPTLIGEIPMLMNGWSKCWQGGLEHVQGKVNKLSDYFNVEHVSKEFKFQNLTIKTVPTTHIESTIPVKSYGLLIDNDVFITGDTQFINYSEYKTAKIIFQDCEFSNYPHSAHAQFHQLCSLPHSIKKKMFLYHYAQNNCNIDMSHKVRMEGFAGLIQKGQGFNI